VDRACGHSAPAAAGARGGRVCSWKRLQPAQPPKPGGCNRIERSQHCGFAFRPAHFCGHHVFDIALLARRLVDAVNWLDRRPDFAKRPLGLSGASTGAAAALVAAAKLPHRVGAVVSRGGRLDLTGDALGRVKAPTLLIIGGVDVGVIELNQQALARFPGRKVLEIVPNASHLFPEPGALETVIDLASQWFERHLASDSARSTSPIGSAARARRV
jgi:putative phosphoribosyl transferase